MVDLATMPDIEQLLTDNLIVGSPAVMVTTKTPNKDWGAPVERFVRVERVGGVQHSPISDLPSVVAEAWAKDEADAAALMKELRVALKELAGMTLDGHKVNDVAEIGGVSQLPDPLGVFERYTLTVSIHIRGSVNPLS